jgi:hypothetical protein
VRGRHLLMLLSPLISSLWSGVERGQASALNWRMEPPGQEGFFIPLTNSKSPRPAPSIARDMYKRGTARH